MHIYIYIYTCIYCSGLEFKLILTLTICLCIDDIICKLGFAGEISFRFMFLRNFCTYFGVERNCHFAKFCD